MDTFKLEAFNDANYVTSAVNPDFGPENVVMGKPDSWQPLLPPLSREKIGSWTLERPAT